MPSADHSDEDLAVAFAAHERWAFAQAYRQYASLLYSAAYNVLRNGEEAQDCVGDAVARLWRAPHAYSSARGSLQSFLVVCVRNEAISRRRRQDRRLRLERRLAVMSPEHDEIRLADPVERNRVRLALLELAPEQRAPLTLAYYQGMTHTEIAAELKEPLGTIKSRIKLGLGKLASALEPFRDAGNDRS